MGDSRYSGYHRKMEEAWDDTEGQVVMYGEDLASTPFTRLTNGNTRMAARFWGAGITPT